MRRVPSVQLVMTPFPFSIHLQATLAEARGMMETHRIRHLPVLDDERPVGILSERDLRMAESVLHRAVDSPNSTVGMVCTMHPFVVDNHARLDEVASELARREIGSALVTREGKLCGILTHQDICRALVDTLREIYGPPTPGDDAA